MTDSLTNIEVYASVKRWLTKLAVKSRSFDFSKSSTKRAGLYWLKCYCKFVRGNPDSLIKDREVSLKSTNEVEKRKHEEYVESFIIDMRRKEYAPNSIATAVGMVRSFYKANYMHLEEVPSVPIRPVRASKVPTVKEIKKMCKVADIPTRAWICAQKDSGLANIDLLSLKLTNRSSEFGTIKKQLRKGTEPIHLEIRRQKTGERTHSFFGPNAIDALNNYVKLDGQGRIFMMSATSIQQKVKAVGIRAKVATKEVPIHPYSLRKFFNTYMKMAGVNEALVEVMMGHSIGRVRSAYLATGSSDAVSGIPISKLAEIYMKAYRDPSFGIDIEMV